MTRLRIGHGYDVHRLVGGRALVLGGVVIPHEKGLDGHSDADAALHAVMDAVLGALGEGDIGLHFPDSDDRYLGADSRALCRVGNLDVTIIAQKPKLRPYLELMQKRTAEAFGCGCADVNYKATTEERLGFTGREEGIAAHAVVLLESILSERND